MLLFPGLCWNVLWCFIRRLWECHVPIVPLPVGLWPIAVANCCVGLCYEKWMHCKRHKSKRNGLAVPCGIKPCSTPVQKWYIRCKSQQLFTLGCVTLWFHNMELLDNMIAHLAMPSASHPKMPTTVLFCAVHRQRLLSFNKTNITTEKTLQKSRRVQLHVRVKTTLLHQNM